MSLLDSISEDIIVYVVILRSDWEITSFVGVCSTIAKAKKLGRVVNILDKEYPVIIESTVDSISTYKDTQTTHHKCWQLTEKGWRKI